MIVSGATIVVSSINGFSAQELAFDGQYSTLIIGQKKPFLPLGFQHGFKLCLIELDDLVLFAMNPTRENHEEKLPGLQDKTHGQPVGWK